jgi:hypothetical protein
MNFSQLHYSRSVFFFVDWWAVVLTFWALKKIMRLFFFSRYYYTQMQVEIRRVRFIRFFAINFRIYRRRGAAGAWASMRRRRGVCLSLIHNPLSVQKWTNDASVWIWNIYIAHNLRWWFEWRHYGCDRISSIASATKQMFVVGRRPSPHTLSISPVCGYSFIRCVVYGRRCSNRCVNRDREREGNFENIWTECGYNLCHLVNAAVTASLLNEPNKCVRTHISHLHHRVYLCIVSKM